MRFPLVVVLCGMCVSCAITSEQAVPIAMRELNDRKISLPNPYAVSVTPDEKIEEPGVKQIWVVTFRDPAKHKDLYSVFVNQDNRQVELFVDRRDVVHGFVPQ